MFPGPICRIYSDLIMALFQMRKIVLVGHHLRNMNMAKNIERSSKPILSRL